MQAEVSLILISSSVTKEELTAVAGAQPTNVEINKEEKLVWTRDSGDINIDELEQVIGQFIEQIKQPLVNIEAPQIWVRLHSESNFAGLALSNDCLQKLAFSGAHLFVSAYAEGKDWGSALNQ